MALEKAKQELEGEIGKILEKWMDHPTEFERTFKTPQFTEIKLLSHQEPSRKFSLSFKCTTKNKKIFKQAITSIFLEYAKKHNKRFRSSERNLGPTNSKQIQIIFDPIDTNTKCQLCLKPIY